MICTLEMLNKIAEIFPYLTLEEFIELVKKGELKWIETSLERKQ